MTLLGSIVKVSGVFILTDLIPGKNMDIFDLLGNCGHEMDKMVNRPDAISEL